VLEGAEQWKCETCEVKRDTQKRTCFKQLPEVIVFNLKRFSFDWDRQLELKTNRYFEFPERMDLGPYTVEGLEARYVRAVSCRVVSCCVVGVGGSVGQAQGS
jgi:ubiquitin C-terminal hydrolase